jgi:hypothetical protein
LLEMQDSLAAAVWYKCRHDGQRHTAQDLGHSRHEEAL